MLQVEAGESKLLLFQNFFIQFFFFTGASPRGARAPKNYDMNYWSSPFFQICHSFGELEKMNLIQPPPTFLYIVIHFAAFF